MGSNIKEPPTPPAIHPKAKHENIRVSPAVLDAARKDGDELLQSLRTTPTGLTQAEAEERARTTGPNEVAQERRQGWFVRLLKIIRNPAGDPAGDPVGDFIRDRRRARRNRDGGHGGAERRRSASYRRPGRTRRRRSSRP